MPRTYNKSGEAARQAVDAAMAGRPAQGIRPRISIPGADVSVLEWWAAQDDPSLSVRLLIRQEMKLNGVTDRAMRPVAKLSEEIADQYYDVPDAAYAAAGLAPGASPRQAEEPLGAADAADAASVAEQAP